MSLGDGGDPQQLVAFRRRANFAEWVPMALILIAILELNGAPPLAVHLLGIGLVVARIAHPLGRNAEDMSAPARGLAAATTPLVILVAAVWAITTRF